MSVHDRSLLPSRPVPWLTSRAKSTHGDAVVGPPGDQVLDAARLIGMTRIGAAAVAPDGKTVVFQVSDYDFAAKKANQQLWLADLALAETLDDAVLPLVHGHGHVAARARRRGLGPGNLFSSPPLPSPSSLSSSLSSSRYPSTD